MALERDAGEVVALALEVPAKVNLHLEVLGRRPDGFHELRTLLQSVDLCDRLQVEEAGAGELELEVRPPGAAPEGEGNLVVRAAALVREATGVARGARIVLDKRIPAGAGLGGGSADAAAALVLLDRLWRLGLGRARRFELARRLGSDVPFFLEGGLGLGVGRGDEVLPLSDLAPLGVVLAMPAVEVPTHEVYARLGGRLTWRRPDATVYAFAAGGGGEPPWPSLRNDLQAVVVERWPEVGEALAAVAKTAPLHVAVTGSGAAVAAVYESRPAAESAAGRLGGRWWTHRGGVLPRSASSLDDRVETVPGRAVDARGGE